MIDLSENTNRWGMPPAAREALANTGITSAYPEAHAVALRRAVAEYLGLDSERVVCGCGSDDVLDAALRVLAEPGDCIAIPEPTFRMLPIFARATRLAVVAIPPTQELLLDVDAIVASGPRVIYLCSPNNPTGLVIPLATIERLLGETDATVILDEAYAEFDEVSALALLEGNPRLLITRTFSKAFGLAALRVGYGVGEPSLIERIAATRGPYQVSAVASRAAIAVLTDGLPWARESARVAVLAREELTHEVRAIGLEPIASRANFVLVPVRDAAAVAAAMRRDGVIVRVFSDLAGIGDAVRITVGPRAEMDQALSALTSATIDERSTRSVACA